MLKRIIATIVLIAAAVGGCAAQTFPQITTQQVTFTGTATPAPVSQITANVVGQPGGQSYYIWVVAEFAVGNATPSAGLLVRNAPVALTSANYLNVSWFPVSGATSYDVLLTTTDVTPSGACNCAAVVANAGTQYQIKTNTLQSYTVNTWSGSTAYAISNPAPGLTFAGGSGTPLVLHPNGNADIYNTWANNGTIAGGAVNPQTLQGVGYENLFTGSSLADRLTTACGSYAIVVVPPTESSTDAPTFPASCIVEDQRGNTGNGGILFGRKFTGTEQYGFAFSVQNLASDGQSATALLGEVPSGVAGSNVVGVRGQVYSAGSAAVYGINFGSAGSGGVGVQGDVADLPGGISVLGTGCASGGTALNPCIGVYGHTTGNSTYNGNIAGYFSDDNGIPLVANLTDTGGSIDTTVIKAQSAEPTSTTISNVNTSTGGKRWDFNSTGASSPCTSAAGDLEFYDQSDNKCIAYMSATALVMHTDKYLDTGGLIGSAPLNAGTGSGSYGRVINVGTTSGAVAGINAVSANGGGICLTSSGNDDLCVSGGTGAATVGTSLSINGGTALTTTNQVGTGSLVLSSTLPLTGTVTITASSTALAAVTGTASITGATTTMACVASAAGTRDPDAFPSQCWVSSAGTVTVEVTTRVTDASPGAIVYQIRVIQ